MHQILSFSTWRAVGPSDTIDFDPYVTSKTLTAAIYVGATGDVAVVDNGGTVGVFKAVPAGTFLWTWARRVNSTGTTATNLMACYTV